MVLIHNLHRLLVVLYALVSALPSVGRENLALIPLISVSIRLLGPAVLVLLDISMERSSLP